MKYSTGKAKWHHGEIMPNNNGHKLLGPCPLCGAACFDYGGGWRCLADYCFNNASNPMGNLGPAPDWWNTGINVIMDGNMWMAHGPKFINIQESHVGFGKTPREAVIEYRKPPVHPVFDSILKSLNP